MHFSYGVFHSFFLVFCILPYCLNYGVHYTSTIPITFADDVRIDGRVYRGATAGTDADDSMPFIINDNAEVAGTLAIGSLGGTGVVSSTNITDGTIAAADLASNSVTSVKIAGSAVTSSKIANGTIATADLAGSAVTSAKIANGTIVAADLASDSVTSAKIADGAITGGDLSSTTDISVDSIAATGDVTQDTSSDGIVKAALLYNPTSNTLNNSFGLSPTPTKNNTGDYSIEFSESITNRYFQITPSSAFNVNCVGYIDTGGDPSGKTFDVRCFDADAGTDTDSYFMLTIY